MTIILSLYWMLYFLTKTTSPSFPAAESLACGWTETSTTAGVTPVRPLGTPCSRKRKISMCRTSRSGRLSNGTVHHWGERRVLTKKGGKCWSPCPFRTTATSQTWLHHQASPGREASCRMLVVRYYCSYNRASFLMLIPPFVKNYLCVCVYLVKDLCSVFAE